MNKLNLSGFTNFQDCLEKGITIPFTGGEPEGTIHEWKGGKYKKTNGKWIKVKKEVKKPGTFTEILIGLKAGKRMTEWMSGKNIERIVETCPRGDWLMDLANRLKLPNKSLILTNAHCANTIRHLIKDKRSIKAIDIAIAFGEGKATPEELKIAFEDATEAFTNYRIHGMYEENAIYTAFCINNKNGNAPSAASDTIYETILRESKSQKAAQIAEKENLKETSDICRKYIGEKIISQINQSLK